MRADLNHFLDVQHTKLVCIRDAVTHEYHDEGFAEIRTHVEL